MIGLISVIVAIMQAASQWLPIEAVHELRPSRLAINVLVKDHPKNQYEGLSCSDFGGFVWRWSDRGIFVSDERVSVSKGHLNSRNVRIIRESESDFLSQWKVSGPDFKAHIIRRSLSGVLVAHTDPHRLSGVHLFNRHRTSDHICPKLASASLFGNPNGLPGSLSRFVCFSHGVPSGSEGRGDQVNANQAREKLPDRQIYDVLTGVRRPDIRLHVLTGVFFILSAAALGYFSPSLVNRLDPNDKKHGER